MELSTLVSRLDDRLDTADYADVDASANGLQVGPAEKTVDHVAFAVDGVEETFERAAGQGADLLVVHHGIVWGGLDRVTGLEYGRLRSLLQNDVALYVAHLPLDGHPEFGNAAGLADRLEIPETEPFAMLNGQPIGRRGRLETPLTTDSLHSRVADSLPVDTGDVRVLDHGPDRIEDVAVVTGSGADFLREAADAGVDAFVTGEAKQKIYHEAREAGVSVLLAGHYTTETVGVRALQSLVANWGPETTFIEAATGL
ncbi:MAG: Nif3-like dinuclear metal center hexameric protein [Halobacteriales archaeon]